MAAGRPTRTDHGRPGLTVRGRATFLAHLYKAMVRRHHREMLPTLAPCLPADGVVVDAGAHAGQYAKLFAECVPHGVVYAFEPGSYARSILSTAMRLRRCRNVRVVAKGLSDAEGETTLSTPIKASGSLGFGLAHLGPADDGRTMVRERVPVTTVDRFAMETGLARLDFIKADIEGWEVRLLQGARDTIAAFRPAIMLELVTSHLERAGSTGMQAWQLLAPFGYTAYRLPHGPTVTEFAGDGDYLFLPGRLSETSAHADS